MTYQMGDSLGGLILILSVLTEIFLIIRIVYLWVKGRNVLHTASAFCAVIFLYIVVLVLTSLLSNEKLISLGSTECFDDWCASIVQVNVSGNNITLELRVSNKAQRVAQTPDNPRIVLIDTSGKIYQPVSMTPNDIRKRLAAGETFDTRVNFTVSTGTLPTKALLTEGSGPPLIGDQNSWMHKKTYFDLMSKD